MKRFFIFLMVFVCVISLCSCKSKTQRLAEEYITKNEEILNNLDVGVFSLFYEDGIVMMYWLPKDVHRKDGFLSVEEMFIGAEDLQGVNWFEYAGFALGYCSSVVDYLRYKEIPVDNSLISMNDIDGKRLASYDNEVGWKLFFETGLEDLVDVSGGPHQID